MCKYADFAVNLCCCVCRTQMKTEIWLTGFCVAATQKSICNSLQKLINNRRHEAQWKTLYSMKSAKQSGQFRALLSNVFVGPEPKEDEYLE